MRKIDYEIKKLEYLKLQKEIQAIEKPWIKDKTQVFALISSVLTFFTVLITYFYLVLTGYFDKKKLELDIDKKTLAFENQILQLEKDSLSTRKSILIQQLDSLRNNIIKAKLINYRLLYENAKNKEAKIFFERRLNKTLDSLSILNEKQFLNGINDRLVNYEVISNEALLSFDDSLDLDQFISYQIKLDSAYKMMKTYSKSKNELDKMKLLQIVISLDSLPRSILERNNRRNLIEIEKKMDEVLRKIDSSKKRN